METKLVALQANRDMIKALVQDEHKKLTDDLTQFVQTEMVEPNGAHLSRLYVRSDFHDELEVTFELGFLNAEGREDFGSDCWFEYNNKGLNINHGTIGCWTKDNVFQIRRIKMLSQVCDILPELEARFKEILDSHKLYVDKQNELYSIEAEITRTEREMKRQIAAKKLEEVDVGTILCYPEGFHPDNRLFCTSRWNKKNDLWKVVKLSEKTIQVESADGEMSRRVNREKLQQHVMNAGLQIMNDNKEN